LLTEKLLKGQLQSGAFPAVGLHNFHEFKEAVKDLDIAYYKYTNKTATLFDRNCPEELLETMPPVIYKFHALGKT
jgi:hypothetical protein